MRPLQSMPAENVGAQDLDGVARVSNDTPRVLLRSLSRYLSSLPQEPDS